MAILTLLTWRAISPPISCSGGWPVRRFVAWGEDISGKIIVLLQDLVGSCTFFFGHLSVICRLWPIPIRTIYPKNHSDIFFSSQAECDPFSEVFPSPLGLTHSWSARSYSAETRPVEFDDLPKKIRRIFLCENQRVLVPTPRLLCLLSRLCSLEIFSKDSHSW